MPGCILIIEDDPASLELLTYLLEQGGHRVRSARDGRNGLQAALDHDHDLVLCDLQLPELTGFEIVARLRAESRWRKVPVVAVTAYSMPGDREAALAAGFSDYLTKPIDPHAFLAQVDAFLPDALQSGAG